MGANDRPDHDRAGRSTPRQGGDQTRPDDPGDGPSSAAER